MNKLIALFLLFAVVEPLLYIIWRTVFKMPEAIGWKKVIPFCWIFS